MNPHLALVTAYFDLVDSFTTDPAAYTDILHPDVEQTEYPNAVYKTLQRRSFSEIIDNLRIGRELLYSPKFDVQRTQACPDGTVIVEGLWQATVISDVMGLTRGQRISSQLCLIFEFKDGKIFRQRRYPCYEVL
ncbi:nuclear transport factor 2 family protein [Hymenobacter cellulosilyticus]|uniref:Nuclear transport factor 2 family protein n=1 Tax=Hymenobacter cellulosilyticus TaxID=2932248 RepID=A0A8T9Q6L3_9BACT|nr:nuclear transport factor 2 family protein [Hymenobacter cellulosilyticus]UOQ73207.1 nuclear transport factor 2 family protein [Hymenobacter cellulosilyticus]